MRYALEKKILTNHIELQDRMIRRILDEAVADFNVKSFLMSHTSALDARKEDKRNIYEADARYFHAREVLERIAQAVGVKIEYVSRDDAEDKIGGKTVTLFWTEASIDDEEV